MVVTAPAGKAAFAALYERYEHRAYNLAYRITGSEADAEDATQAAFLRTMRRLPELEGGEAAVGPHLFTATLNACHDLLEQRQPAQSGEAMPAPNDDVGDANMRLPERQREALAMRELGELSYEEIAAGMEMTPESVAKLISRARLNLSGDLHGTALAVATAPSPECERALPLIAAREDGQLAAGSDDEIWLDTHLAGCERCELSVEAMRKAATSYREWAPIAVLPWLREETMSKAAALDDVEWSDESGGGSPSRRRRATAAAGLSALLLGGVLATVLVAGKPPSLPDQPVADTHPAVAKPKPQTGRRGKSPAGGEAAHAPTAPQATTASSTSSPAPLTEAGEGTPSEPGPAPADHQAASGLQPKQTTGARKPKPAPSPPSQPTAATASPTTTQPTAQPPVEEAAPEHPSKGRGPPDGVPPGRP